MIGTTDIIVDYNTLRIMKNALTMLKPKYIGISKFSLVSWRISMLCDGVVHTMLLHILLPTKCSVTPGLSHRSVAVLGCIYNIKYKFWQTHTHNIYIYMDTVFTLHIDHGDICTILHVSITSMWNIKHAINSWYISPPAQKEAEDVTLDNSDINQR